LVIEWIPFVLGRAIRSWLNDSLVVDCRRDDGFLLKEIRPRNEVSGIRIEMQKIGKPFRGKEKRALFGQGSVDVNQGEVC
jgi:hypothetical protein